MKQEATDAIVPGESARGGSGLERLLDLPGLEELEHVAFLDVGEAVEHDPTLHPLLDLGHVVLEATQRTDLAAPDNGSVANQADAGGPGHLALRDHAACDGAHARGLEGLLHLSLAE